MIEGLERFVVELRRRGIRVSPAECLDAMRAVERVGLAERARFRHALAATLVKRAGERASFDEAFDAFFATPAWGRAGRDPHARGGAGGAARAKPSASDRSEPRSGRPPARPSEPREREARATTRAVLARLAVDAPRDEARQHRRLRRVLARMHGAERRLALPGERREATRRELARTMSFDEEREIAREVSRVIEAVRLRRSRRERRAKRGRLYLRRLFRENLRHGGVPWVLPRRKPKLKRTRLVLLVDVSWSVARASGLFLSVAVELLRRARDARVLLFVDRGIEATAEVAAWLRQPVAAAPAETDPRRGRRPGAAIARGVTSFARLVESLRGLNLDAPSDYGRAFDTLLRSPQAPRGRLTGLVVLGDGRTNRFAPQAWAFEELASRAGFVVWLVPEPLERWGTGDSALGAYLPHADVAVEASDLEGLARGVAEIARRL